MAILFSEQSNHNCIVIVIHNIIAFYSAL